MRRAEASSESIPASIERSFHSRRFADTHDADAETIALLKYDLQLVAGWLDRPGRLLDLGCATGRVLLEFAHRGFDVTGVDLSARMLQIARAKAEAAGLGNVRFVEGNIADLPLDQLSPPYDYALCLFATLGQVRGSRNRLRAVRQAASLLAPGGQYVFHVQNLLYNLPTLHFPFILTGLVKWMVGCGEIGDQIFWSYRGIRGFFMHAFRPGEIRRLVQDAGLELMEIAYLNDACDGPLQGDRRRDWRSHGFIVRTRRPAGAD